VDGRIFFTSSRQLSTIRTQDLPLLTTAICGFERGLVSVERCWKHEVGYVRFFAPGFEVFVLANDWQKVVPYLFDGSLTPSVVAPQPIRATTNRVGGRGTDSNDMADLSTIAQWDAPFFQKVYATLRTIFTESYPTSRL
jgi:hypothetical protein